MPIKTLSTQQSPRIDRRRFGKALGLSLAPWALGVAPGAMRDARAEAAPEPVLPPQPLEAPPPARYPRMSQRTEDSLTVKGIYVQQTTAIDPARLRELIEKGKRGGFTTFVVDLWRRSPEYNKAIETILAAGLRYVPRVTIFPDGARREQIDDYGLLGHRAKLIEHAIKLGATDVQIDYIRFSSRNTPSPENANKVRDVIRFFRDRVQQRGAKLQIDIFGEVSYGPSLRIGQDIRVFAPELDAVCPMLYPSHFEPYKETAKTPYETVHGAILGLERQIKAHPIPIYPYIEHFNYRYRMSDEQRAVYFEAQLEAVLNSSAQGFYIWSVGNYYDIPVAVLERRARERG
ncbi:MAG TPA: putative glycoside hydrolase [Polyangiaceae bacterium]|nr:putative glycoside hydrolase [Polyangiaceae bacterium]